MLKIRLSRIGAKNRPFYRVVVVDGRAKRTGAYIELLGTYNPLTTPHEVKLKQDRIDHWVKNGAQMSDGFLRIIGKAKQRPPRKTKKTKEPSVVSPQSSDETKPTEKVEDKVAPKEDGATSEEVRGDGEEGSSGQAAASETSEDGPGDTEPAGPRTEKEESEEK